MKRKRTAQSAFLNLCIFLVLLVFFAGLLLTLFAMPSSQAPVHQPARKVGEVHCANGGGVAPPGAGQEAWVARYNGPANGFDGGYAIALDGSGNVYVTGESGGLVTGADYVTIKYDSAGQEQWVARYNGHGAYGDSATAIAVDEAGIVYV